jgi:hypothetical protein
LGATLLWDGTVALIIDVPKLVSAVIEKETNSTGAIDAVIPLENIAGTIIKVYGKICSQMI